MAWVAVVTWAPVIMKALPQIAAVGQDLYALYTSVKGSKQQNESVIKAMKLLNKYQDDIDKVLQDPRQKKELLEGLKVLMERINEDKGAKARAGGGTTRPDSTTFSRPPPPPYSARDHSATSHSTPASSTPSAPFSAPPPYSTPSHYSMPSSASLPSYTNLRWKVCEMCYSEYNTVDNIPLILICGHTFCQTCLRQSFSHAPQCCPTCQKPELRPFSAIPPNIGLMRVLEGENKKDSDSNRSYQANGSCCGGGGGGGGGGRRDDSALAFEEQVQFAINLSQQEAQIQGKEYVEMKWQEVLDAKIARAMQDSEIYEYTKDCVKGCKAECGGGALNPPDKKGKCEATVSCAVEETCGVVGASPTLEDASLTLALELQQQELSKMQIDSSSDDWKKNLHAFFGLSVDGSGEGDKKVKKTTEREENASQKETQEEAGGVCSGRDKGEGGQGSTKGAGAECGKKIDDDDDCCKKAMKKECSEVLEGEEQLLIQMAIERSLQ